MKKLLVALLLFLTACSTGDDAVIRGTEFDLVAPDGKLIINYPAADRKKLGDLTGESLMEPGKQIKLSDYSGKVVVLNLWGAWCGPCRAEAPELQQLYTDNKDAGLQVLGIDVRDDIRSQPEDFIRDRNLTYPSIYDKSARTLLALKGYPRNAVPSTIILDREHKVAAVYLIATLAKDIQPLLKQLMDEQKPS
jgi:thiol-disulfide isomerase/thioredoxin